LKSLKNAYRLEFWVCTLSIHINFASKIKASRRFALKFSLDKAYALILKAA
jgi:hypothetical protein